MMKILLICVSSLLTMQVSLASECKCEKPAFTEEDETTAVCEFIAYNLESNDIRTITVTENIPYAVGSSCKVECLNLRNTIRKISVEFVQESKLCVVGLMVTMRSKRKGFKTKVNQELIPVCE